MNNHNDKINDFINYNTELYPLLKDICHPLFSNFNFSSFGYTKYLFDGSRMVLETNHDWFKLYDQLKFNEKEEGTHSLLHNIMMLESKDQHSNILVGNPKSKLHEALFSLNIWNSISIYTKTEKYIEVFHLATSRDNDQAIDFYVNRKDLLQRFIYYFREKLHDLNLNNAPFTPPDPSF